MCGITGIVKLEPSEWSLTEEIRKMTDMLRHRGPDGEGYLFANRSACIPASGKETSDEIRKRDFPFSPEKEIREISGDYTLAFGHRRLSIIDLSPSGHQPMCTPDKNLWITYNGEIYNYIELRDELKTKGHVFYTESDTEVILAAYQEWGEDCLSRFNGMWAFVIYNQKENFLFGARDRVGVKPFYYYHDRSVFAFASEQKALAKIPFIKTGVNTAALFDFFTFGESEREEEGLFSNIMELFPSHSFRFEPGSGKLFKKRYYSLPDFTDESTGFEEAVSETRKRLIHAVSLRLRSDVPVGVCLSGGIDSSAITGIIHHLQKMNEPVNTGGRLKTFTACFPEKEIDESHFASEVARIAGAQWLTVSPHSKELLNDLEALTWSQDIPLWSTSTYAQHRVMKLASENGIKVVLDGQGADELFAGYFNHNLYYWIGLLRKGKIGQLGTEMKNFHGSRNPLAFFIRNYIRSIIREKTPSWIKPTFYKLHFPDLVYLSPGIWNDQKHRIYRDEERYPGNLNQFLRKEFYNQNLKTYLKCEDRCSMWHSVESRTPFSDDVPLIEYTSSLPAGFKIRNGTNKALLREAAKKLLPGSVYNRKDKKGFSTPNNRWIHEIKDKIHHLFEGEIDNYLDVKKLRKESSQFFSQQNKPDSIRIFRYISFAQWVKTFFAG